MSSSSLGVLPSSSALASVQLLTRTFVRWLRHGFYCNIDARPQVAQSVSPESSTAATPAPRLSLSPAREPFPRKLVDKVRSGQFVEMRDMLTDNIALKRQMESFSSAYSCVPALPGAMKPRLRDVFTLPSWMYCFLAMRSDETMTRNLLPVFVVQESQRHGGTGWMDYDRVFRQQAAIDHNLSWISIHPGIQAATSVCQASGSPAVQRAGPHCNPLSSGLLRTTSGGSCDDCVQQVIGVDRAPVENTLPPSTVSAKPEANLLLLEQGSVYLPIVVPVPAYPRGTWRGSAKILQRIQNIRGTWDSKATNRAPITLAQNAEYLQHLHHTLPYI